MKIATNELQGKALTVAVRMAQGFTYRKGMPESGWAVNQACLTGFWRQNPSKNVWACVRCQCEDDEVDVMGLIENAKISVMRGGKEYPGQWCAESLSEMHFLIGPTAAIAAQRCFVASRLGAEVDVPEELCA